MSSQNPGCLATLLGFGNRQQTKKIFPYKAKQYFLSNAEASFHHFLKQLTGENITIFPHAALRDLVTVTGVDKKSYYKFFNQIDRKQIDFLLVDSKTLKPMLVIELDDQSHQRKDRIKRDEFVEKVLESAGIPIVRIPVKQSYDAKEIGELFRKALHNNQSEINNPEKRN